MRRSGPASAAAQTSALPTVDRLAVRVLVDSYQDALVRTARVGNVEVQRFGVVYGPAAYFDGPDPAYILDSMR